jgi:hypothetical protein
VWSGEGPGGEGGFLPSLEGGPAPEEPAGGHTRRRLSGLKQLSVEKIATIRQRLAEGRRLLRTRSESEDLARSGLGGPECITGQVLVHPSISVLLVSNSWRGYPPPPVPPQVGSARLAVQGSHQHGSRQLLSGEPAP